MKAFIQIAKPHEDIFKGNLTMDVFAADLWQVVNGKAPVDYQDKDLFFRKTYMTKNLENILEIAKKRLEGKSGDSVIQLQTPFGGGKTHTLIALYHKAKEWNTKVVVFDGTAYDAKETKPWEELERQITGKVEITKGDRAPGKEKIIDLLTKNSPVLILMDEILTYATKAATIKVGDSNLASQTLVFMQELTGAISTIQNALLVMTLPSSALEHYDEYSEKLFQQFQNITGRIEKISTPVEDEEIDQVIRKRLFQSIDEGEAKKVVDDFVEYARDEGLLSGDEVISYRDRFLRSYPFKPEVIDILYKRWGSFPSFQRTRGVLRLLSLVIYELMDKNIPFIRLGDFNLENNEIRRELIKHIGQEWDSIIAQDITSNNSGTKKVDDGIGSSYKSYKLGTVVSTTIFMLSFSGKGEKDGSIKEIKLSSAYPAFSTNVIDTVISQLRENLFYLSDEELCFTNQPNLNKILLVREEGITQDQIIEEERGLLEKHIKNRFKNYIYPNNHRDVPDTKDLKLIILKKEKPDKDFLENCGENPRVYRNNMIFLCTDESWRGNFYNFIRKMLALRSIEKDQSLNLTANQRQEIKNKIRSYEQRTYEELREYYRKVFIPDKGGNFNSIDLGIPTTGDLSIDAEIYKRLKSEGELLEKISPTVIIEKYLSDKDYVQTEKLLSTLWRTPGEMRIASEDALKEGIKEGVANGLFGLGYLDYGTPKCKHFKRLISPELSEDEIIIKAALCVKEPKEGEEGGNGEEGEGGNGGVSEPKPGSGGTIPPSPKPGGVSTSQEYTKIHLKLKVPKGKMSDVTKIVTYLNTLFNDCEVDVEITTKNGKIAITDYENKIEETLKQANIHIKEENKEGI